MLSTCYDAHLEQVGLLQLALAALLQKAAHPEEQNARYNAC